MKLTPTVMRGLLADSVVDLLGLLELRDFKKWVISLLLHPKFYRHRWVPISAKGAQGLCAFLRKGAFFG